MTSKALEHYFKIVNQFEKIKKYLSDNKETYFNYFYNLFAYKFQLHLRNPNFYHYTAEAWILTVFKQLEERLKNGDQEERIVPKPSFNDILDMIYQIELDEDLFIENLEILLGTYKITDHVVKITQMKLSQLFLKKLNYTKELTISKRINEDLTRRNFEDMITLILKKALNYTLNELDPRENDKNSLNLMITYTDLTASIPSKSTPSLEEFISALNKHNKERNNEPIVSEVELLNPAETFYYFAITSFSDLLRDIQIFTLNSSSIIYKLECMLKNNFLKLRSLAAGLVTSALQSIKLKSISNYLHKAYLTLNKKQAEVTKYTQIKYHQAKVWVLDSYFAHLTHDFLIKSQTSFNQAFKSTRVFLYTKVYSPCKDVLIFYSNKSIEIIVNTATWSKEKIEQFYSRIKSTLGQYLPKMTFIKRLYEHPIVTFTEDNQEKYLNVKINLQQLSTDYSQVIDYISVAMRKYLSEDSFNKMRSLVFEKFRKMLGMEHSTDNKPKSKESKEEVKEERDEKDEKEAS